MKNKPIIIIGGGGHASVLAEVLLEQNRNILGFVAPSICQKRQVFNGLRHFKCDKEINDFNPEDVKLVNGIGLISKSKLRQQLASSYRSKGFKFETVIDDTARVSKFVKLFEGIQILANATIQTGSSIGRDSIINSAAIVEHDAVIGNSVHIAPGATIAGGVSIGEDSFIGAQAVVKESISIGESVVVGAGITVLENLKSDIIYVGKKANAKG